MMRGVRLSVLSCLSLIQQSLIIATVVRKDIHDHLPRSGLPIVPRIKEIIKSGDQTSLTDYLHGEAAQTFIDVVYEVRPCIPPLPKHGLIVSTPTFNPWRQINQVLESPCFPLRLWRHRLSTLSRLCGCLALLPRPLQIPVRYDRWSTPQCRGGFADVWKGQYQGRPIAIKVTRAYQKSDLDKIRRVRHFTMF